jgi:hypothetical protein
MSYVKRVISVFGFIQKPELDAQSCVGCAFYDNTPFACTDFQKFFEEFGVEGCRDMVWVWPRGGDIGEAYKQLIMATNIRKTHE